MAPGIPWPLHAFPRVNPFQSTTLQVRYYSFLHFTDGEAKAPRGKGAFPRSHSSMQESQDSRVETDITPLYRWGN